MGGSPDAKTGLGSSCFQPAVTKIRTIQITNEYIEHRAPIYKDIRGIYLDLDTARTRGSGLAFQSLYPALDGKYKRGEFVEACKAMVEGGAIQVQHDIFAHPT